MKFVIKIKCVMSAKGEPVYWDLSTEKYTWYDEVSLMFVLLVLKPEYHDDVIKWKHFPCHWPFVRGIHRSPVNSPHKGQWRGALMFSLICAWIHGWVNNREGGDLRRHRANYDVTVMCWYNEVSTMAADAMSSAFTIFIMRIKRADTFHEPRHIGVEKL